MTTDSDSECSYANWADFNVMRVIVIVIKIIVIQIVYNSKKCNNSDSINYSNNRINSNNKSDNYSNKSIIIVI